jgi:hypothetical protein
LQKKSDRYWMRELHFCLLYRYSLTSLKGIRGPESKETVPVPVPYRYYLAE